MLSLVFVAANEFCIWHDCCATSREQWFKCQQQRGYRSTMFTVIEKIQGGGLSVVEVCQLLDIAVSNYL